MGLYQDRVLPFLTHVAMSNRQLIEYRTRVVSAARGRVLEVGIGSGLNMPYYGNEVSSIYGIDPSTGLLSRPLGSSRVPSGTSATWAYAVRRTWPRARSPGCMVPKPTHALLAMPGWRLSPQSQDRCSRRRFWISYRSFARRIYAGAEPVHVHVRGLGTPKNLRGVRSV
jgi:Methyltransferase domain